MLYEANLMPRPVDLLQQLDSPLGLRGIHHQLHASQRRAEKWIQRDHMFILQMTVDTRILQHGEGDVRRDVIVK